MRARTLRQRLENALEAVRLIAGEGESRSGAWAAGAAAACLRRDGHIQKPAPDDGLRYVVPEADWVEFLELPPGRREEVVHLLEAMRVIAHASCPSAGAREAACDRRGWSAGSLLRRFRRFEATRDWRVLLGSLSVALPARVLESEPSLGPACGDAYETPAEVFAGPDFEPAFIPGGVA